MSQDCPWLPLTNNKWVAWHHSIDTTSIVLILWHQTHARSSSPPFCRDAVISEGGGILTVTSVPIAALAEFNATKCHILILCNAPLSLLKNSVLSPLESLFHRQKSAVHYQERGFLGAKPNWKLCLGRRVCDCGFLMQFVLIVSVTGMRSVRVCVCEITEGLAMLQCNRQLEQKSAGTFSLSVCLIIHTHTYATLTDVLFAVVQGQTAWKSAH